MFSVHCFPYSIREGTRASKMPQILNKIKKERLKIVEKETEILFTSYIEKLKNNNVKQNVLIEEIVEIENKKYFVGHSEYFVKCYINFNEKFKENDIIEVRIEEKFKDGVIAL